MTKRMKRAIKEDLAILPPGKASQAKVAADWEVALSTVRHIAKSDRQEIGILREVLAERGFIMANALDEVLMQKIQDPAEMKETPLRDVAQARERIVNSSVTALEGHQKANTVDLKAIMEARAFLKEVEGKVIPV